MMKWMFNNWKGNNSETQIDKRLQLIQIIFKKWLYMCLSTRTRHQPLLLLTVGVIYVHWEKNIECFERVLQTFFFLQDKEIERYLRMEEEIGLKFDFRLNKEKVE